MDEGETKICENCKREVPAVNFTIHAVHCMRNIRICPVCKEPVQNAQLQQHHDKMHKLSPCQQCGDSVRGADMEDHVRDSCAMTMKTCRFCLLELRRGALPAHERYCGARTELCECGEWVMHKYRALHLDSNHGFVRLHDDPEPVRAEPAPPAASASSAIKPYRPDSLSFLKNVNNTIPPASQRARPLPAASGPSADIRNAIYNTGSARAAAGSSGAAVAGSSGAGAVGLSGAAVAGLSRAEAAGLSAAAIVGSSRAEAAGLNGAAVAGLSRAEAAGFSAAAIVGSNRAVAVGHNGAAVVGLSRAEAAGLSAAAIVGSSRTGAAGLNGAAVVGLSRAEAAGLSAAAIVGSSRTGAAGLNGAAVVGLSRAEAAGLSAAAIVGSSRAGAAGSSGAAACGGVAVAGPSRAAGSGLRNGAVPSPNVALAAADKVQKNLWAMGGAVKKRPAPKPPGSPPAEPRAGPREAGPQRRRQEGERRREQPARNLPAAAPAGRELPGSGRAAVRNPQPQRRNEGLKNLKPMTPREFAQRFDELQLREEPARNADRFGQIKSSLRELRRGLNEVTAPYGSGGGADANQNAESDDEQLPCEFCGEPMPADELVMHETGCRPDLVQYWPPGAPGPGPYWPPAGDAGARGWPPAGDAGLGAARGWPPAGDAGLGAARGWPPAGDAGLGAARSFPPAPPHVWGPASPMSSPSPLASSEGSPSASPPASRPASPLIPCEFCTLPLPVYLISEHQERCRREEEEVLFEE